MSICSTQRDLWDLLYGSREGDNPLQTAHLEINKHYLGFSIWSASSILHRVTLVEAVKQKCVFVHRCVWLNLWLAVNISYKEITSLAISCFLTLSLLLYSFIHPGDTQKNIFTSVVINVVSFKILKKKSLKDALIHSCSRAKFNSCWCQMKDWYWINWVPRLY